MIRKKGGCGGRVVGLGEGLLVLKKCEGWVGVCFGYLGEIVVWCVHLMLGVLEWEGSVVGVK